jgi:hypothetical protein
MMIARRRKTTYMLKHFHNPQIDFSEAYCNPEHRGWYRDNDHVVKWVTYLGIIGFIDMTRGTFMSTPTSFPRISFPAYRTHCTPHRIELSSATRCSTGQASARWTASANAPIDMRLRLPRTRSSAAETLVWTCKKEYYCEERL